MNAICLVIDRLHAGYLGAYGNAGIETPALDRLASQSFLFDRALIDSPELERLYRSYWQGWHAMCLTSPPQPRLSLPALLGESGVKTVLLTDEPQVSRHPLAADFDEFIPIDPPWQAQSVAQIDQTHLAKCFVQIIEWLEAARGPYLLWCHLGGLGTTWDAPLSLRQAYCEEGDPPPPDTAEVPDRMLPPDHDPDELLGITQSYAGQVALLDACTDAFLEFLDSRPDRGETLLTLTSSRGFPLGEHGRVGPCDEALFGELVHVPWMLRLPDAAGAAVRTQALAEPADVWATLLDWWDIGSVPFSPTAVSALSLVRQQTVALRDRLGILGVDGERALRTPAWYLRTAAVPELFAKPDDRWEVNDVASRCHDVVEALQETLLQFAMTLPAGRIPELPALNEVLLSGLE